MNLHDLVTRYVAFRRAQGERCQTNESILRTFCRTFGSRARVRQVRLREVAAFLAGNGLLTRAWHNRY